MTTHLKIPFQNSVLRNILLKGLNMGAHYFNLMHKENKGPIYDPDIALQTLLENDENGTHSIFMDFQQSAFFLFANPINNLNTEISIMPFFSYWKRDFFYIGYDIDLARYCSLLFDLVSDHEIIVFEEIRDDAQRNFIFGDNNLALPIIEICLYINPDIKLMGCIDEVISNALSQKISFLNDNFRSKKNIIAQIYDFIIRGEKADFKATVEGYAIQLFFKINEDQNMVIGIVPQEPFAKKIYANNISGLDAQFYLNKSMGLANGFFIYSFYAQSF